MARVGIVEAKVAAYYHSAALKWASSNNEAAQRRGDLHLPSGHTRLPAGPVQLEEAVWKD